MKLKHLFETSDTSHIKDPETIFYYAFNQGKSKRVPELEHIIKKSSKWAQLYARYVIQERWLEAEPVIKKNANEWNYYLQTFSEARSSNKNIPLVLDHIVGYGGYIITDIPNTISDEQVKQLIKLIAPQEATNIQKNNK